MDFDKMTLIEKTILIRAMCENGELCVCDLDTKRTITRTGLMVERWADDIKITVLPE